MQRADCKIGGVPGSRGGCEFDSSMVWEGAGRCPW